MEHSGIAVGAGGARIYGAARRELDEAALVASVYGAGGGALGAYYRAVELYNRQVESACADFGGGAGRVEAARFCAEHYVRPVWHGGAVGVGRTGGLSCRVSARVGDGCTVDDGAVGLEDGRVDVDGVGSYTNVDSDTFVGGSAGAFGFGDGCDEGLREDVPADGVRRGVGVLSGRVLEKTERNVEVVEEGSMVGGGSARGYTVGELGAGGVGAGGGVRCGLAGSGVDVGLSRESRGDGCGKESAGLSEKECEFDVPKGKNWKKNQRKKMNRRGRVNVDTGPDLDFCSRFDENSEINVDTGSRKVDQSAVLTEKSPLRASLERKWALENELKALRAEREIELLRAEDREAVKKLRERKVQGATERTMVQIEKAHASLVQTGNVPGAQPVQQGFCQTVVDGEVVETVPGLIGGGSKGCSISPSSSISEREVREMKKELEDLRLKCSMLERREKRMGLAYDVLGGKEHVAVSVVDGSVPESARQALDKVCGKGDWEAVGDLDMDPDTLYLQMDYSNKFDYGGCY